MIIISVINLGDKSYGKKFAEVVKDSYQVSF